MKHEYVRIKHGYTRSSKAFYGLNRICLGFLFKKCLKVRSTTQYRLVRSSTIKHDFYLIKIDLHKIPHVRYVLI